MIRRELRNLSLARLLWEIFSRLEASDPRDHIFALLGLADDDDRRQIRVDYGLPVEAVFTQAMKQCLVRGNDRHCWDLLSLAGSAQLGRYRASLPSWVPDFSSPLTFFRIYDNIELFSAAGNSIKKFSVIDSILNMAGKIIDTVKRNGHNFMAHFQPSPAAVHQQWMRDCREIAKREGTFYSRDTFEDVWWSLLVCDLHWPDILKRFKRADDGFGKYHLHPELVAGYNQSWSEDAELVEAKKQYQETMRYTSDEINICATEKGLLGWIPRAAKEGDKICIFAGTRAPFLVRDRHDGSYELAGNAYIQGIMYGEATQWEGFGWEDILIR